VKHWEDFKVGESTELGSHAITEAEILAFARKYDPQPFHTDPEAARRSIFGGLIASGWHTCALMMRLSVEANRREEAAATGSPGLDSCRWLKPVRPGDVLTGATEILETWPSRTRPIGFVRRRVEMVKQNFEGFIDALMRITFGQQPHQRGQMSDGKHRMPGGEQIAGAQAQAFHCEMSEMLVKPRSPGDARLVSGLQNRAQARTRTTTHKTEMTAMGSGEHFEDDVRLAVPPRAENNRFVGPLHRELRR